MEKTAAIVVTYNRCEMLRECLAALSNSEMPVDILVIDNASTDDTRRVVEDFRTGGPIKEGMTQENPPSAGLSVSAGQGGTRLRYYNTGKNLGGAGGFHFGLKTAYKLEYAYFWLMDDDTMVAPDSLGELFRAEQVLGKKYGFLSSLALWKDEGDCLMNHHLIASDWNLEKKKLQDGIVKVKTATFVSFLLRREVVKKVGLPIKEYYIWGDDTEYSFRISEEYACYLVSNSTVLHKMEENIPSGKVAEMTDISRIERMYYSVRNDCCTYRRAGLMSFVRYTKNVLGMLCAVARGDSVYRSEKLKSIAKGYLRGLVFHPRIEPVE